MPSHHRICCSGADEGVAWHHSLPGNPQASSSLHADRLPHGQQRFSSATASFQFLVKHPGEKFARLETNRIVFQGLVQSQDAY